MVDKRRMLHGARKRFGQHFLHDKSVIAKIIQAIDLKPGDQVVEIGPGRGALTYALLGHLQGLHVVEIDRDLAHRLTQEFSADRLTVHNADALRFDFSSLGQRLRLVGNLPYNISTPLLFHLAGYIDCIRDCLFMLQSEVVDRMVAQPSTAEYGRLSVGLQSRFDMQRLFSVAPGAFTPPPKVESAIVRMRPLATPRLKAEHQRLFAELVTAAFTQRRKTLRNSLKSRFDEEDFQALSLDPRLRAEDLSVDDFINMTVYAATQASFPSL